MNIYFNRTCFYCPEQYDVFDMDRKIKVANIWVRWGGLTVTDSAGCVIYSADIQGDGGFYDETERRKYMNIIQSLIEEQYGSNGDDEAEISNYEKLQIAENDRYAVLNITERSTDKTGIAVPTQDGGVYLFYGADDGSDDKCITVDEFNAQYDTEIEKMKIAKW